MGKAGFSYYMAETDRFQDIKVKRLKKRYGCEGYALYQYALNEIYRVEGCWIEFSEDELFDASEYWGIEEERVKEIIHYCAEIGLFDTELWSKRNVLTARSIQSRYLDMCKRSKKKAIIPLGVLLVEAELVPEAVPAPMPLFIGQPGSVAGSATIPEAAAASGTPPVPKQTVEKSTPETSRTFGSVPECSGNTPEKTDKEKESKANSPSIPRGNSGVPPEREEEIRQEVQQRLNAMRSVNLAPQPPAQQQTDDPGRNIDGLMYQLQSLNLTPAEQEEVLRLSAHGQIGNPVWGILNEIRTNRKIKMPRLFLLSRLRKSAAS
ncbi:DUF4373 domain-containing protein [Bacteroides fragilis]|uniref:DUF4373 domain-containing protein n=1 Tax=Bacteroides fragilis TaxID=817 RepID=UPI0011DFAF10|nr:DUF4373 domain-containing protein [Bacteroides fragilis]KAB7794315.1 DUF4373 domain-containing protein [Bacteroides fragilis]MDA1486607.1 DUF4373 domain-containing protein [Bacteroides fragilis]